MRFLLDTNACIAIINGRPPGVRAAVETSIETGDIIATSAIATFELWYGVTKSLRGQWNTERLEVLLAGPLTLLPFDEDDARVAGEIRAELERLGQPIGAYDVLIAGQAKRRGMTLVTANVKRILASARFTGGELG